jgi:hypothetical protein
MKKKDLDELVTIGDFEKGINELKGVILSLVNPQKDFLTPKEFAARTGQKYSSIVNKCNTGKLKAYQESPCSSWFIDVSEIDRIRKEADENKIED